MSPTGRGYPQEISQDESFLGFEPLLIEGIGDLEADWENPVSAPVVAKILSSSDILLKIFSPVWPVAYSHRRWGYSKRWGNPNIYEWHALGSPVGDAGQLISDFSFQVHKEPVRQDIIGKPFKFTKIQPEQGT
jgi:hypothetical protein